MTDTDWAAILARKHRRILTMALDVEAPQPSQETIMAKTKEPVKKGKLPGAGRPSNPKP